jgi:hypothetical protein
VGIVQLLILLVMRPCHRAVPDSCGAAVFFVNPGCLITSIMAASVLPAICIMGGGNMASARATYTRSIRSVSARLSRRSIPQTDVDSGSGGSGGGGDYGTLPDKPERTERATAPAQVITIVEDPAASTQAGDGAASGDAADPLVGGGGKMQL